ALNASAGTLLWSAQPGLPGAISSSPAVLKGVARANNAAAVTEVVVGSEGGSLDAFNASSGSPLWTQNLGSPVQFSSPALLAANGATPCEAFVGTSDGIAHALNCSTGLPLWSHLTGAPIQASPAISSCGTGCTEILIGSEDGVVYALDS